MAGARAQPAPPRWCASLPVGVEMLPASFAQQAGPFVGAEMFWTELAAAQLLPHP